MSDDTISESTEAERGLPWGEMPYDGKTPREVVDDYVLIRGDLVAEYARAQLALWIERYATARLTEARSEVVERIKEFDFSDDYHQGDDPEGRYYAGLDRACRLILGDIATWTDPRLPAEAP